MPLLVGLRRCSRSSCTSIKVSSSGIFKYFPFLLWPFHPFLVFKGGDCGWHNLMLAIPVDYPCGHVVTSSVSLISVQARKIAHFTAPSFPKESDDFSGTLYGRVIFLCSRLLPYLSLPAEKKILCSATSVLDTISSLEFSMRWNREVDRAIVSGVAETEIQQIKKEYISDRIKESIDLFGRTCPPTTRKGSTDQTEDTAQTYYVCRSNRLSKAV